MHVAELLITATSQMSSVCGNYLDRAVGLRCLAIVDVTRSRNSRVSFCSPSAVLKREEALWQTRNSHHDELEQSFVSARVASAKEPIGPFARLRATLPCAAPKCPEAEATNPLRSHSGRLPRAPRARRLQHATRRAQRRAGRPLRSRRSDRPILQPVRKLSSRRFPWRKI